MKIHREGTNILIVLFAMLAAVNVATWFFWPPVFFPALVSVASIICYSFVFNFFRCPARKYRGPREGMIVSSVDGKVVVCEEVVEPEFIGGRAIQVSVFMSPLNVHANWYPADGQVVYVRHHRGRFLSAYLPKASIENERSTIGMITADGQRITVRQVAGAMARRIVTYAKKGMEASIDDHLGFIKFGSRVDIYLPLGSEVLVNIGDRVSGGLTPFAKLPKNQD